MIYDKKTGDVTIIPKKKVVKDKIISNYGDLQDERTAILKEMGVPDGDMANMDLDGSNREQAVQTLYEASLKTKERVGVDYSQMFAFSRDLMRVDVGLIIARLPIFAHMRDPDIEMMKTRSKVMNEYYCDFKKHIKEFSEVTPLNESVLSENPYASEMNLDNYPSHEYACPDTGETLNYCAASKNFAKVDPECDDMKSLHYAGEDRTYLILKNRFTQTWEFPVGTLNFDQTLLRAKTDLFKSVSENKWRVRHASNMPTVHTIRDFTVAEKEDAKNAHLKGVRTYYFMAYHWRGLADMDLTDESQPYDDFRWVPKRQLNEFFDKDYYDIFINGLSTR